MNFEETENDEALIRQIRELPLAELSPAKQEALCSAVLASYALPTPEREAEKQGHIPIFAFRFLFPALVLLLVLVLSTGTAIAADRSKPGDALFGLDRAIERVQLSLAVTPEAKAKVAAGIAVEREQEQQELVRQHRVAVLEEANTRVDEALTQAQQTVDAAQKENKNENASPSTSTEIKKVQEQLTTLKEQHAESLDALAKNLTKAQVRVFASSALVTYRMNGKDVSFQLRTTDQQVILKEICKRTGIPESLLKSAVTFHLENPPKPASETGDGTTNTNAHSPESNTPSTDPSAESNGKTTDAPSIVWTIQVHGHNRQTDISVHGGTIQEDWTLNTRNQAEVLASIAAKTGLTTGEIASIWNVRGE